MKRWRLLLLLALTAPLFAQNALWIDLSGDWRIAGGDDARYASADFDDRSWSTVRLPLGSGRYPVTGPYLWLRRQVILPPDTNRSDLSVSFGTLPDVYEVFINGQRIGDTGSFTSFEEHRVPRPETFSIPPVAVPGAGAPVLVIALRIKFGLSYPAVWRLSDRGPWALSSRNVAPLDAGRAQIVEAFKVNSPGLLMAVAIIMCGAFSFALWLGERSRRELLWFALYAFSKILGIAFTYSGVADPEATPWNAEGFHWQFVFQHIDAPITAMLTASILGVTGRWVPVLVFLSCLPAPLSALLHFPAAQSRALNFWMFIVGPVISGFLVGRHWLRRRSRPVAREDQLLWTILLLVALDAVQARVFPLLGLSRVFQTFVIPVGGFVVSRTDIFALLISLSVSWLLLRRLAADRRERQRLAGELEAARAVQQLLLPAMGTATGAFEMEAIYEPAQEVGGDFYWSRTDADGALLVALGDVSGKGLQAAMLVSVAVGILRNEKSSSPAALLAALNSGLAGRAPGGFVTCCCARFDPGGYVTIANAGHPSPYAGGHETATSADLPLGLVPGIAYSESVTAGDHFTFVSDGVIEAENAGRELFGFERTRQISTSTAREIAQAAKSWGQTDDITVLTVRRNPA